MIDRFIIASLVLLALPLAAQERSKPASVNPEPPTTARKASSSGATKIGPDDTLNVSVLHSEELTGTWRVNATGDLRLPLIGTVKAAGLTVEQFEADITKRIRKFINEPHVSVFMSESRSRPVTVIGAVDRPGTLQLQGRSTLLSVLNMAGGAKEAGPVLTITRDLSNGIIPLEQARTTLDGRYSVAEVNLEEVLSGRGPVAELEVLANDLIRIPQKQTRLVHIIGEVNRPGSVELATTDTVSITRLIAAAGGFTRTAKPNKAIVRHIGSESAGETAVIDLNRIVEGKAADLQLGEGDVLIVPSNQLMQYLQTLSLTAANAGVFSSLQILTRI
jgi:polysaccharide biosynthesis/export protein